MSKPTLLEIEKATKDFASARYELSLLVTTLNDDVAKLKKEFLPSIKKAVAKTAERQCELKNLIDHAHDLFEKPRTVIFHGIKVGLQKGRGEIDWDDDQKVVELIRKHFREDQADALIITKEKPSASALRDLTVAELKKIGCTVEETDDEVVIKPADSDVDKVVNALLKDAMEEAK